MPKFQDDEGRREALYAALPALVILDPQLKPGAVRLYGYLRLRKGQNSKATTTIEGIGLGLGVVEKTLYDHIKELESRHYLRRERQGYGKPMTYILPTMEEVWRRMNPVQRAEVKEALLAYGFKEDHLAVVGVVETTDSIPSNLSSSVESAEDDTIPSSFSSSVQVPEYGESEEQNIKNPSPSTPPNINGTPSANALAPKGDKRIRNIFAYYTAQAIRELGFKPPMNGSAAGPLIKKFLGEHDEPDAFALIDWVLEQNNDYLAKGGKFLHMIFDTYCVGEWLGSQNEREPAEERMTDEQVRDAAIAQRTREAYEQGRVWSPLQGKPPNA